MATKKVLGVALCFAAFIPTFVPAAFSQENKNLRLNQVLAAMDQNAKTFRNAQASFTARMFNSVVNAFVPPDDAGRIYLQKTGSGIEASAIYTQPRDKQIKFSGNTLEIYQNGQRNTYDATAHHDELETFLVLGFGSSGDDMRKSFDIQDLGPEAVEGSDTEKLELVPKSASVLAHVPKIILWIDPKLGVSRQQQIYVEKEGDYRLATYTNIAINRNLPKNAFKFKAVQKTVIH
jgi:outer membrane lipoprotein-sorting protein